MYVNKPTGVPQATARENDPARNENCPIPVNRLSAAHASAQVFASASQASLRAASAATRADVSSAAIPRVPLHRLGASAAAPDFVPALDHDVMSVMGGYLNDEEKLQVRSLGEALHKGIDKSIAQLHLKPAEAIARAWCDWQQAPPLRI